MHLVYFRTKKAYHVLPIKSAKQNKIYVSQWRLCYQISRWFFKTLRTFSHNRTMPSIVLLTRWSAGVGHSLTASQLSQLPVGHRVTGPASTTHCCPYSGPGSTRGIEVPWECGSSRVGTGAAPAQTRLLQCFHQQGCTGTLPPCLTYSCDTIRYIAISN